MKTKNFTISSSPLNERKCNCYKGCWINGKPIYFDKAIENIYIIDFFEEQERQLTGNIASRLQQMVRVHVPQVEIFPDNTREDVISALRNILHSDRKGNTIIQSGGHGFNNQKGFGNNLFGVSWEEIYEPLCAINTSTNDGLIINATIMCHGIGIFQLIGRPQKPFYAAVGSLGKRSGRAYDHNKFL